MEGAAKVLKLNSNVAHENSNPTCRMKPERLTSERDKSALKEIYEYDFKIFGFEDTVPSSKDGYWQDWF